MSKFTHNDSSASCGRMAGGEHSIMRKSLHQSSAHKIMEGLTQKNKITDLLSDYDWHCTSEMYSLYIADVRRRICDLKDDGFVLESRKCQKHSYHLGGSKEWKIIAAPEQLKTEARNLNQQKLFNVLSPMWHS